MDTGLIEYFLGAIGGATVALGAAAFLAKRFMDIQVSRAIESHKAALKERVEALKTELSIYAHEQTVGLSRIDAQRSDAILAIWHLLGEWQESFIKITAPNKELEKVPLRAVRKYEIWAKEMLSHADKLSRESRDRAILFDQESYDVIANYGRAISIASADFCAFAFEYVDLGTIDETALLKRIGDGRADLHKQAKDSFEALRLALLKQFRLLLSAEKK
jgi:hypothetical protein